MHPHEDRRYTGYLIADVARLMRATFDRRVRRIGLTKAQWQVLSLLHHRPGASQTELAEMMEVERATAGRMVDRLERNKWVERRADASDRRVNRLYLTAEAHDVQADMGRIATELMEDAMSLLDMDERELLADMMERMKTRLQALGPRAAEAGASLSDLALDGAEATP